MTQGTASGEEATTRSSGGGGGGGERRRRGAVSREMWLNAAEFLLVRALEKAADLKR